MTRQNDGRETWSRLLKWDKGSASSERLAAQILKLEKYISIDPSHPMGGADGLKDLICEQAEKKYIVAIYFPRDQKPFKEIKNKFLNDVRGVEKNNVDGVIFITNQELKLSERKILTDSIQKEKVAIIYHLERISSILNTPESYGVRLEFLDIEMTKEEQLAYMATKDAMINDLKNYMLQIISKLDPKDQIDPIQFLDRKVTVVPDYISANFNFGKRKPYHKCTHCGYGYKVMGSHLDKYIGGTLDFHAITANRQAIIGKEYVTCPNCGNVDEFIII